MSNGIELKSVCCQDSWMVNLEGEYLTVKLNDKGKDYVSHIPVYTCKKCNLKWALERVINSKPQTQADSAESVS